eukprot:215404_1
MAASAIFAQPQNEKKYQLHIAIDFGTDGLGLAYAIGDKVYIHNKWNSERYVDVVKPKTIILLDKCGNADAFGSDAKEIYMKLKSKKDHMLFERFKMSLYDNGITDYTDEKTPNNNVDIKSALTADNGRTYPSGLVFLRAFKYIQKESRTFLRKKKIKVKKEEIQWILTVPAIWSNKAKYMMTQWITKAGLVDENDKTQCKIVYEPDCASLAIQYELKNVQRPPNGVATYENDDKKTEDNHETTLLCKGEKYILIDAGGGTVDIACHEVVGAFGVREILPPSGGPWGSCKIDDQYKQALNQIFGKELMSEFKTKYPNIYMRAIHNFQGAKATFDEGNKHHNCRLPTDFISWLDEKIEDNEEIEDVEDILASCAMAKSKLVELNDDVLTFHRSIWISMFDQVMDPIQEHVEGLLCKPSMKMNCKYLCLVGGLSCSPYFQHKMKSVFGEQSEYKMRLIIPKRPILSVVYGAACFGIVKNYIKARRVAHTYGIARQYSVSKALERGVSQAYIDKHKKLRSGTEQYRVTLFHPIIRKGTEVCVNQVFQNVFHGSGSGSCVIRILASAKVDPTLYSAQDIIVKSTIKVQPTDPPKAPVTVQWHLYDTTIKIIYYVNSRPNDKTEMEIAYE